VGRERRRTAGAHAQRDDLDGRTRPREAVAALVLGGECLRVADGQLVALPRVPAVDEPFDLDVAGAGLSTADERGRLVGDAVEGGIESGTVERIGPRPHELALSW